MVRKNRNNLSTKTPVNNISDQLNNLNNDMNKFNKNMAAQMKKLNKKVDTLIESQEPGERKEGSDVVNDFQPYRDPNAKVRLNVDGIIFHSNRRELRKYPDTRLGKLAEASSISEILKICDEYKASIDEFCFKKRNINFSDILEFYRSDSLHISSDHCKIAFNKDLEYWEISSSYLQSCCANELADAKDDLDKNMDYSEQTSLKEDQFQSGSLGRMQESIWTLFENPHSSKLAGAVSIVSLACILLSTITMIINTFPQFHSLDDKYMILGDYYIFFIIEAICVSWFVLEFLLRFFSCPSKVTFIKQFLNWIDILVIFPYIILVATHSMLPKDTTVTSSSVSFIPQIIRISRIIKPLRIIARMFKFARYSAGMIALGRTLKSKYKELGLILIFLGLGTVVFALLAFMAEAGHEGDKKQDSSHIGSMLDAYWWAVITITTVGYGDLTPKTWMGKVIGTICPIFGVLVVSLPIPLIGNVFDVFYVQEKRRIKVLANNSQDKKSKLSGDSNPQIIWV